MTDKFKIGDRVGSTLMSNDHGKTVPLHYNEYNGPLYGTVVGFNKPNKIIVEWDEDKILKSVDESTLRSKAEIDKSWSSLEEEFFAVSEKIKGKMKEAAKLLTEAHALSKKTGQDLAGMYDAIGPLLNAMDDCGWRTSSFNC